MRNWPLALYSSVRQFSRSTSVVSKAENLSLAKISTVDGGRQGNAGKQITVFGATGFIGRYVVNELGAKGNWLTVCTRGDDMSWRHMRPAADLGKMIPAYFDLDDEDSIRRAIEGADVVINLQGKYYETKHIVPWVINTPFEKVHIKGNELLARISRESEVKHFVHLSSTATDGDEATMSRWALTKKRGDEAILREFPGATIVKSNVVYGEEDRLLNWFAIQIMYYPFVPLFGEGAAKVQPVYVGDVAKAISTIAENYILCDEKFVLHGPQDYSYKELAEYVGETIGKTPNFGKFPFPERFDSMFGRWAQMLPTPSYTEDMIKLLQSDQIDRKIETEKTFADLGMKPFEMERKGFNFLYKYRDGGHFADPKAREVTHS